MLPESIYEVKVRAKTLAEALKIIQLLDTSGYKEVEMGPPRPPPTGMITRMAYHFRGRLNKIILRALHRLGAVDREHGVEADKLVGEMKRDTISGYYVRSSSEGIISRTVTMVCSAILAEKHGWVSYDLEQTPRIFWLTEKGIEKARSSIK